jgi:TorA maturation chaperone TorD
VSIALVELARFREGSYRLLSQSFLYPDEDIVQTARALAAELCEERAIQDELAISAEFRQLCSTWRNIDEPTLHLIQKRYVSLFAAAADRVPCPPYESTYLAARGISDAVVLASVERDYATAGLYGSSTKKQSPDHISMETEFLAVLCGREAQAWEMKMTLQGVGLLEKESKFIEAHLGSWLRAFTHDVRGADAGGVYAHVAAAALAFVTHDRDLVKELAASVGGEPEEPDEQA